MSKLKNIKTLTTCALMLALAAILGMFKIPINQLIEIRFGSLPIAIAGAYFGPVIGAVVGGLSDIVQFIVKPTGPYFPGFTISAAISGLIFGIVLKEKDKKIALPRIIIAEALHTIIVGCIVNTLNLYILYGKMSEQGFTGYFAYMATRLPKEAIMFPINCILLFVVLQVSLSVKNRISTENV